MARHRRTTSIDPRASLLTLTPELDFAADLVGSWVAGGEVVAYSWAPSPLLPASA